MRNPIRRLARRLARLTRRVTGVAERRRAAHNARQRYFQLDRHAAGLRDHLARTAGHRERYALLAELATVEIASSRVVYAGWRDTRRSTDDRMAGLLLRMVAYAERDIADGEQTRWEPPTSPELERAGGPVLDRAVAAGRIDRAVLNELHTAVYPVVGGQAAEAIACLPVPGNRSDYKVAG